MYTGALGVSVVIPTYKRRALLRRCLHALSRQTLPHHRFEVIVADDEASEETEREILQLAEVVPFPLHYIAVTATQGPAAARNAGARSAHYSVLAFTDDDCVPDSCWLDEGLKLFHAGALVVAGAIRMPISQNPTDFERNEARLAECEFVTANCFVRRDVFWDEGGFDESFTCAWREDSDLLFRFLKRGISPVQVRSAVVVHPVRSAPWGISVAQQRKIMFDALLFKKHRELYRRKIRRAPPWSYYATVLSFLSGISALFVSQDHTALLFLTTWCALTVKFFLARIFPTRKSVEHIVEMACTSILIPFLSVFWRLYGAFRFRVAFL